MDRRQALAGAGMADAAMPSSAIVNTARVTIHLPDASFETKKDRFLERNGWPSLRL